MPDSDRLPALFLSHGAAWFTTQATDKTHQSLRSLEPVVAGWRPRAVVVVSAHHQTPALSMTAAQPLATVHDHPATAVYGFRWPARGEAWLSALVEQTLRQAGLSVREEPGRGLDHGAWVPLSLLMPSAQVPVLALSLAPSNEARAQLALGAALAPLRGEGVLLVGSGGATHSQQHFREGFFGGREVDSPLPFSVEFDAWVRGALTTTTGQARLEALAGFEAHPLARLAHPTPEHFFPLLVMAGAAAEEPATALFTGFQHSLSTAAYQLGSAAPRPAP